MSDVEERLKNRVNILFGLGLLLFMIALFVLLAGVTVLYDNPLGQLSAMVASVFAMLPFLVDYVLMRKASTFVKTGEREMPMTSVETRTEIDPTSRGQREIEKTIIKTQTVNVAQGYRVWHFESLNPQTLARYTSLIVLCLIVCLVGGAVVMASIAFAGPPASDSIGTVAIMLIVVYILMMLNIGLLRGAHEILSKGVKAQK
jgi:hypothetical protein